MLRRQDAGRLFRGTPLHFFREGGSGEDHSLHRRVQPLLQRVEGHAAPLVESTGSCIGHVSPEPNCRLQILHRKSHSLAA